MVLKLSDVAQRPDLLTSEFVLPTKENVVFRPLSHEDAPKLAQFLENLSPQTRIFYVLDGYDLATAREMCRAINRYDKLRFVLLEKATGQFIALVEYSFDIPESDTERFLQYDIHLSQGSDCRIGPCISDAFQDRKVGTALFPLLINVARQFGQKHMILWGGVFADNERAVAFYEKNGFTRVGTSTTKDGKELIDMMIAIE
jgi:RimJ/RimL family protein N-acetyltransferase